MSIVYECEYRGLRYAGLDLPKPGEALTLRRSAGGRLRAALIAGGSPAAVRDAVAAERDTIEVAFDDPDLRFLPPLLPQGADGSIVNGFMGTHRSKFDADPAPDEPFEAPNYYLKGSGSWLRMPDEPLRTPADPLWMLEEPEVALVHVNDDDGVPHYAGYTFGNDLNDIGVHLERPWAWTPYAKLCETSIAPWLFLEPPPRTATGTVAIEREGETAWEGPFSCGADALFHNVEAMTDHLLAHPLLRRPGLVNYLLLGADKASYHGGFRMKDGDRIVIDVASHGVVLANPVRFGQPLAPAS
jgi:hypothetical protein